MKIYTKKGDSGQTKLCIDGQLLDVYKNDSMIELVGSMDELNASIGLILVDSKNLLLAEVQNALFALGSLNAVDYDFGELTDKLEIHIDKMTEEMPRLKNFILPGGSELSARTHLARAVCRRLERQIYDGFSPRFTPEQLSFVNRLSDFLFTLARYYNYNRKINDVIWRGRSEK